MAIQNRGYIDYSAGPAPSNMQQVIELTRQRQREMDRMMAEQQREQEEEQRRQQEELERRNQQMRQRNQGQQGGGQMPQMNANMLDQFTGGSSPAAGGLDGGGNLYNTVGETSNLLSGGSGAAGGAASGATSGSTGLYSTVGEVGSLLGSGSGTSSAASGGLSGGASSGGGALASAGPWAALAAAIIGNEWSARDAGRRDEDGWTHAQDLLSGKVLEQDMDYYGDKVGGVGGEIIEMGGQLGHPEGVWDFIRGDW